MNKIGYVYSGAGGAIGFLAGASSVLQRKYNASHIVGVSSGSLVGIMHATNNMQKMFDIFSDLIDEDVVIRRDMKYIFRFAKHLIGIKNPLIGFFDNTPLRNLLIDTLIDSKIHIDFTSIVVDYHTGNVVKFNIPKGTVFNINNTYDLVAKVLASTAIPVVFSPEKINGRYYIDGGVETHTPIKPMEELMPDCDHMCIISTAGHEAFIDKTPNSDLDIASNAIGRLISNVSERDFERFELKNKIAKLGGKYIYYPSTIIRPSKQLAPTTRFHSDFIKKDVQHGITRAKILSDA